MTYYLEGEYNEYISVIDEIKGELLMSNKLRLCLAIILMIVGAVYFCVYLKMNPTYLAIIYAVLISVCVFGYSQKWRESNLNKKKDDIGIKYDDEVLYVNQRHSYIRKLLTTKDHKITDFKKTKEELVYRSVTVGGVTTGGVTKKGGNIRSYDYKSGRYELHFLVSYSIFKIVKRIHLNDTLANEAKQSSISDFLDGNDIIVVEKTEPFQNRFSVLLEDTWYTEDDSKAYPTLEKCEKIISWLSNENP